MINLNYQSSDTSLLPSDFQLEDYKKIARDSKKRFLQFCFSNAEIPDQGFKIHISATQINYQVILDEVFDLCKSNLIDFKYISNREQLLDNLAGKDDLWASGKFITIYPSSLDDFKKVIVKLYENNVLKVQDGIAIFSDRRYRDSNVIFYRYGRLKGPDKWIYNPITKLKEYRDYESMEYRLPAWVDEPFPDNSDDSKTCKYLFKKIIPTEGLNSKPSGATFLAHVAGSEEEFVLKNAHPGYMNLGVACTDSLKNEAVNIKRMMKFDFIPNYIADFSEDEDYFLCEEKKYGLSVDDYRADSHHNFIDKKLRKKTINDYRKSITDLLKNVQILHDERIFLGDISSENVLVDPETNLVSFVDLEQSVFLEDHSKIAFFARTEGFFDENTPFLAPIAQDNQQLAYLLISFFCRGNMFLLIDHSGAMTINFFKQYASTHNLPKVFVDVIMDLLEDPNQRLDNLVEVLDKMDCENLYNSEDLVSLDDFQYELVKSVYLAMIDGIQIDDKKTLFFEEDTDLIFNENMVSIYKEYLQKPTIFNDIFFEKKMHNHVISEGKRLVEMLKDGDERLAETSLVQVYALLLCTIKIASPSEKIIIDSLINYTQEKYMEYTINGKFFRITEYSTYLSPYFADGTAGMINILLEYREKFHDTKYDASILDLVNSISQEHMPKNSSLYRGLGSFMYVLQKFKKIFKSSKRDNDIREMFRNLPLYSIVSNGNRYMVDESFRRISLDFADGNAGIIFLIEQAKQMGIL